MPRLALAGKPNAGKSTFFNAATEADVDIGNYPFTTIDPNRGITYARTECPCLELESRCGNDSCANGKRYVSVELIDVAGLVPGAHEGRGLGNQFLDALMDADVIMTVIDASGATDETGEPVEPGTHDPVAEVDFIEQEINEWIAGIIERNWESIQRQSRSPDFDFEAALTDVLSGLGVRSADVVATLRDLSYEPDPFAWSAEDKRELGIRLRERKKPIVLVANKIDAAPASIFEELSSEGRSVIPVTSEGELALRNASESGIVQYDPGDDDFEILGEVTNEQRDGLEKIRTVIDEFGGTGVQSAINTAVYEVLDMVTAYPVENETRWTDGQGNTLPDAFLLPRGATPRDLAYAVHSDIGDGYLHAINGRSNRRISEDYELEEGDVIKIVSTAG